MLQRKTVFAINWMEVDALANGTHENPHHILGMHESLDDVYINVYIPNARRITAVHHTTKKRYTLTNNRVPGFFSIQIKNTKKFRYSLKVKFDNGKEKEILDPYVFGPVIDPIDISRFNDGIHYEIYEKLGAHPMILDGIKGVLFAVWAPNAERVSVVGNFNFWNGKMHPMRRIEYSGIYELFIPDIKEGELYKFEIRSKSGDVFMKTDPYGNASELRPANASIVADLSYEWKDEAWCQKRAEKDFKNQPINIYEVHLGSWKRPSDGKEFFSYREIAKELATYIKEMGYTHVELMPIMEHPFDPSWGYQVTGYYAPTARYGTPKDFMYFVEHMHKKGIGVILDWVPGHFPKDTSGLGRFDGKPLYEAEDPKLGEHPHWGTYIFDYGKAEVSNFLVANALYWADKYHIDGIRVDAVASLLYLDYGREPGEWIPNEHGGNENIQVIAMLKQFNEIMKEKHPGVIIFAEESTAWPMLTTPVADSGLGFDYKWNMGWMHDVLEYMSMDPLYRKYEHKKLTYSMEYAYSEKFLLVLSHDEVVHGKGTIIGKMPGGYEEKFSNLRLLYGLMMTHPGKKLLFMGQEFAQFKEFDEMDELDWNLFEFDAHVIIRDYVKALNSLYLNEPALHELDHEPAGFEWLNDKAANESIISFVRKSNQKKDTLLIICNFTPITRDSYKIGVPYAGKYKEIFNSQEKCFGGDGTSNKNIMTSKRSTCDGKKNSITINVAPLSISVIKLLVD